MFPSLYPEQFLYVVSCMASYSQASVCEMELVATASACIGGSCFYRSEDGSKTACLQEAHIPVEEIYCLFPKCPPTTYASTGQVIIPRNFLPDYSVTTETGKKSVTHYIDLDNQPTPPPTTGFHHTILTTICVIAAVMVLVLVCCICRRFEDLSLLMF